MSEKKSKEVRRDVFVPVYNVEKQMDYLIKFCKSFDFNPQVLLSLILAEFIYTVESGGFYKNMKPDEIFVSYLERAQRTRKDFDKLKSELKSKIDEVAENGKDNSSH